MDWTSQITNLNPIKMVCSILNGQFMQGNLIEKWSNFTEPVSETWWVAKPPKARSAFEARAVMVALCLICVYV